MGQAVQQRRSPRAQALAASPYPRHLAALFDRLAAEGGGEDGYAVEDALKAALDNVHTLCQVVAPPFKGVHLISHTEA